MRKKDEECTIAIFIARELIQYTYNVQTFDDGNKIIRMVLSEEYEPLCLSTKELKKLIYEWNNIKKFKKSKSKLYDILMAELEAGNTIRETYRGGFCDSDETTFIFLNVPLKTKVRTDITDITHTEVNAPHYWNAEYGDKENRFCLAW